MLAISACSAVHFLILFVFLSDSLTGFDSCCFLYYEGNFESFFASVYSSSKFFLESLSSKLSWVSLFNKGSKEFDSCGYIVRLHERLFILFDSQQCSSIVLSQMFFFFKSLDSLIFVVNH